MCSLSFTTGGFINMPPRAFDDSEKVRFISGTNLLTLPDAFVGEIESMAKETIKKLFAPQCLVWHQKKKRERWTSFRDPIKPSSAMIKSATRMFNMWSDSLLKELIKKMTPKSYTAGEIVVYAGEPHCGGLILCSSGDITIRNSGSLCKCETPLFAIGAASIVTEELSPVTMVADSPVDCWCLPRLVFEALIPNDLLPILVNEAFLHRNDTLHRNFPATISTMRRSVLLRQWPEHLLNYLTSRLKPLVLRKRSVIFTEAQKVANIVFVMRGCAERVSNVTKDGRDIQLRQPITQSVLGDIEFITGEQISHKVECKTACDCWTLSGSDLQYVLNSELARCAHQVAFASRRSWMQKEGFRILPLLLLNTPVFGHVIKNHDMCFELVSCFSPEIYHDQQTVTGATSLCTRVILIFKGNAVVQRQDGEVITRLQEGDAAGYTAFVPQKWKYLIRSCATTDCWEGDIQKLKSVFIKYDVLPNVLGWCLKDVDRRATQEGLQKPAWFVPPPHVLKKSNELKRKKLWSSIQQDIVDCNVKYCDINDHNLNKIPLTELWPPPPEPLEPGSELYSVKRISKEGSYTRNYTRVLASVGKPAVRSRNHFGLPMGKADWIRFLRHEAYESMKQKKEENIIQAKQNQKVNFSEDPQSDSNKELTARLTGKQMTGSISSVFKVRKTANVFLQRLGVRRLEMKIAKGTERHGEAALDIETFLKSRKKRPVITGTYYNRLCAKSCIRPASSSSQSVRTSDVKIPNTSSNKNLIPPPPPAVAKFPSWLDRTPNSGRELRGMGFSNECPSASRFAWDRSRDVPADQNIRSVY